MAGGVTVPGTGTSTISEVFNGQYNSLLAQQIANALLAASIGGTLNVTTAISTNVPPPPANPGGLNELIINTGGDYTIPAGSAGSPDYVVILDSTAPVTIHGSPNSSIWGGAGPLTIIDPAVITVAEGAGDVAATVSGIGDVLAGNTHNDTLTAAGSDENIFGGSGTNVFFALGAGDTVTAGGKGDTLFGGLGGATFLLTSSVTSGVVVGSSGSLSVTDAGTGDTIFGGAGALNVATSGSLASVVGGSGAINAVDSGTSDTIVAGTGAMNVALGGTGANVTGGPGFLSVTDNGTSDTIAAGLGVTSISAPTSSSFVQGGAGTFSFIGGTGNSTIVGGSGDGTVFGSTGMTSVVGGPGGAITYVNTTSGGLWYNGGSGNETIDASLSKGPSGFYANTIFGGHDSTGHELLIGGTGSDLISAGSGPDTLVGGGGSNFFYFWSQLGGSAANDVISDFSAIDNVLLVGYAPGQAAAAIAGATTSGGSTTITLSDNTKITFTGVTNPAALDGHIQQA